MEVQRLLLNAYSELPENVTYKVISQQTGITQSTLSRFFSAGREISFYDTLKLTRLFLPDREKEIMALLVDDYIECSKPAWYRCLMLYLCNAHMFDEMNRMIEGIPAKCYDNVAFAELLVLFGKQKRREIIQYDLISSLTNFNYDLPECHALKHLLLVNGHLHKTDFNYFFQLVETTEQLAMSVSNEYIKISLHTYACEMLGNAYLFQRADTKKARKYLEMVKNSVEVCDNTHINIAYSTAMSYIYEDFNNALEKFEFCLSELRSKGKNERADYIEFEDIPFLYSYWRKELPQNSTKISEVMMAYNYFQTEKHSLANSITKNLKPSDPFGVFVKGLVENSDALLATASLQFKQSSNALLSKLSLDSIRDQTVKAVI